MEFSHILGLLLIVTIILILTRVYTWRKSNRSKTQNNTSDKCTSSGFNQDLSSLNEKTLLLPKQYKTSLEGYNLIKKLWEQDPYLHKQGRELCKREAETNLNNSIGIYKQIMDNPTILNIEIKQPVFISSFMRTGSTLLYNLVAVDSRNYSPYLWELLYPLPQECSRNIEEDVKIRKLLAHQDIEYFYNNGFEDSKCINEKRANYPGHCYRIFDRYFVNRHIPTLNIGNCMQDYAEWFLNLQSEQIDDIYALYKEELQFLMFYKKQYDTGIADENLQLFLSDNTYMYFLESLLKKFPDAIIINLHRDPVDVLGSTISLNYTMMKQYYQKQDIDGGELARRCLKQMTICKDRLMEVRSRIRQITGRDESDVFVDIKFADLCLNPKQVVLNLYNKIGKGCTNSHVERMEKYLKDNPRYKRGKHTYNITDFGLNAQEVRDEFEDYIDKFL